MWSFATHKHRVYIQTSKTHRDHLWMSSKVELSSINPGWLFSLRRILPMSYTLLLVHEQSLSCLFSMHCGYDAFDPVHGHVGHCLLVRLRFNHFHGRRPNIWDDMRCCEGRVERSVLVRLRLNHRILFMRSQHLFIQNVVNACL